MESKRREKTKCHICGKLINPQTQAYDKHHLDDGTVVNLHTLCHRSIDRRIRCRLWANSLPREKRTFENCA
jgi:hypothetical protein